MPQTLGKEIGPIGYGMMGLTWDPKAPTPDEQAFSALRAALENGSNFWDGGENYGPFESNSLVLLERYFAKYPEDAKKVVLSIKGGGAKPFNWQWDSSPKNIHRSVNDSTEQLKGRKKIDLFEIARHDGVTPYDSVLETLDKDFVKTGIIDGISLSEVGAQTIHNAVKVAKIAAVEVELSLFSTDPLTNGVAEACAMYDIPLIAYSPLCRGMLSGRLKTMDDVHPLLRKMPRFFPDNLPINLELVEQVRKLAEKKGCTVPQFAINWVRCQSKKPGMPTIIPIPGGSNAERVAENTKIVDITLEEIAEVDAILDKFEVHGGRYPDQMPVHQ